MQTTTAKFPFKRANAAGDLLFEVRAGVPALNALEVASCYMAAARDAAMSLADSGQSQEAPDGTLAIYYLVDLAKVVLDSVLAAHAREIRQQAERSN